MKRTLTVLLFLSVCGYAQTISVARLLHKTPAKAWASLDRASKLLAAGATDRSAAELQRAVSLDPGFPEAHCNLGVTYMVSNRTEEAAAEFRRAIALDPGNPAYHTNLGAALAALGRAGDGEQEARTALGLDSANAKAHFLLGLLLAARAEARGEAGPHLAYAAQRMPEARDALTRLQRAEP